jgi:hypothetical protein
MSELSVKALKVIRVVGRFSSFLFQITGISRMIGYESVGWKHPRSIMDPSHNLSDEWKNTQCDCNIKVTEVDMTML